MAIEAPYKGRDDAPAPADKATADQADKPEAEVEEAAKVIEADKPGQAPQDEPEVEEAEEVEEEEEVESKEVPDADTILMRADYTRKTQALGQKAREIEARESEMQNRYGVYERVDALIAQNPDLAKTHSVEQLVAMLTTSNAPLSPSALPPEYKRELAALRSEQRELKEELFADKVQASMKRIKRDYGLNDAQVKAVVETAVAEDLLDYSTPTARVHGRLDLVAAKLNAKKASVNGQRKLVKKLVEKGRAASGGTASAPTDSEANRPMAKGWDALTKQLIAERLAKQRG